MPLPGQLKPVPEKKDKTKDEKQPKERVAEAHALAKVDPAKDGYINAIQVYPCPENATAFTAVVAIEGARYLGRHLPQAQPFKTRPGRPVVLAGDTDGMRAKARNELGMGDATEEKDPPCGLSKVPQPAQRLARVFPSAFDGFPARRPPFAW